MFEFFVAPGNAGNVWLIILLTGVVTYITRSGGYLVLSRFKNLHPRAEAALEAVPGAVLVTLVLPSLLENGSLEVVAMGAALVASLRLSPIWVLAIGMVIVIGGRAAGF
ncbi:MAG: AzlD domain-containing protein [Rhizobiaceae bacterium]|nr:AzlD domain-containing protein [Rhizobiaceae bacterium]